MSTAIIIQARLGSTRLPEKMILPFYQDKNILSILLENLLEHSNTPVILATTTNPNDDKIADIANEYKINIFRGDENNVLDRFIKAAEQFNIDNIIRVCADNPFLQINYVNQLISEIENHNELDYISYTIDNKTPAIKSHIGLFAEATTSNTLKKVARLTANPLYLEHVTNFIYSNEKFNIKLIPTPNIFFNRLDLRFTLDTQEDFNLLKDLYLSYKKFNNDIIKLIEYIDNNKSTLTQMNTQIIKNSK
ncbi:MAG: hypothetical protein P1U41_01210 [Vicingaceae bacterium]|nr:hypothetical protein [Vicingaceae bacterium]